MLQNVKVDIIYYLTNTDFEMEFNLCGCCRMRLLTDKATDRKGFINMLSRAVARSRIIIACGGLFSETGLISTVAQAVGKPLEVADNASYGIKDDTKIKIISGSIPLVTPDGYFGGCIIESGPQTIILLSESRNIRKSIMQNLIHPYIEEFSMNAAAENAPHGAHEAGNESPDAEETVEQGDEVVGFVSEVDDNIEPLPSAVLATEETDIPMHLVPERIKPNKTNYYDIEYKPQDNIPMYLSDDDDGDKKIRSYTVPVVIFSVLLALLVLVLAYFLVIVPITSGYTIPQYIESIFGTTSANAVKVILGI